VAALLFWNFASSVPIEATKNAILKYMISKLDIKNVIWLLEVIYMHKKIVLLL